MEAKIGQHVIDEQGQVRPLVHYAYRTDKKGVARPLIHYAYRTGVKVLVRARQVEKLAIACHPECDGDGWCKTGEVGAVTCQGCRATERYRGATALVHKNEFVHYAYPTGTRISSDQEKVVVACAPESECRGWARTNEIRAVNCVPCKATEEYQKNSEMLKLVSKRWKG